MTSPQASSPTTLHRAAPSDPRMALHFDADTKQAVLDWLLTHGRVTTARAVQLGELVS